jgi:hypothetical protein
VQIRDVAARANTGAWIRPVAHPDGLGVAQRALPEAGSMPYPPTHSNASSISPPAIGAERDASAERGGPVQDCPGAHPGGLGEHKARDTLCPKPAACHTPRRIAMPARPHRWNATCQPGGAGRCGAVWYCHDGRSRVVEASFKGPQELHRLHECIVLRRHPWHSGTSLLGKTSNRRDAQHPWSAFLIATVATASPTGARTARRRQTGRRDAREGVLLGCSKGRKTGKLD